MRYRYDGTQGKRYKTVELIEGEVDWAPSAGLKRWDRLIGLHVEWGERKIAEDVRVAGGVWDKENRYWKLQYRLVRLLKLEDRMFELR